MIYPSVLADLVNSFKKLPGIGDKSAERMALSILELNQQDVENFSSSMIDCHNNYILVRFVDILQIRIFVMFVLMNLVIRMLFVFLRIIKVFLLLKKQETLMEYIMC